MKKNLTQIFLQSRGSIFFPFLLCFNFLTLNNLHGQYFYNYEDFFSDSTFILKNNIKVVTIRVPDLVGDSTSALPAYQKLCFNSFGKLTWFEYDSTENNMRRKFYTWHFYDENAQRFKSRIFQRCENRDSLREEVQYSYNPEGRLYHEQHYQIFIAAYREWAFSYEWQGDSLKIKTDELDKRDTTFFDKAGRPIQYSRDAWRYTVAYDSIGRKSKLSYFQLNEDKTEETKIDDMEFVYNNEGKVEKIITSSRIISYIYDHRGLPFSSMNQDKFTGQKIGFQIFYDYELKNDFDFAKQH